MTFEYALKNAKEKEWYCQGGGIKAGFVLTQYPVGFYRWGNDGMFVFQRGNWNMAYFDKATEKENLDRELKNYLSDPGYLKKLIAQWKEVVKERNALLQKLIDIPQEEDLKTAVKAYLDKSWKAWDITLIIEETDCWGDAVIETYAKKNGLSGEDIAVLTSPAEFTFLQQEMIDRLNGMDAKSLFEKYFWMENSWQEVKKLTVDDFSRRIKETDFDDLRKEVEAFRKAREETAARRAELMDPLDDETRKAFNFLRELNDWRDLRKVENVCKHNLQMQKMLDRLAELNKLPEQEANHVLLFELDSLHISDSYRDELSRRVSEPYLMYMQDKEIRFLHREEAEKIFEVLEAKVKKGSEVSGKVAFPGKARGVVKVINTVDEFSEMQPGDVLVSIMTRPEMVPLMKMACAIVTDEGGVTCHAAIVSRELKIPCIVGTQTASRELKDGDFVEVDAEEGVVRKITE